MTWPTIWDAFTAIGTVAMAVTTGLVIRRSKQEHRDTFRPICMLVPDEGLDAISRRGIVKCYEEPNNPAKAYLVQCSVKNIGSGPALNLRIVVRFSTSSGAEPSAELSALGSKEHLASPVKVSVFLSDQFNRMDYEVAPGEVWELLLIYEDVFGNVFHTRHTKDPQQPWSVVGKGGMK
jgi:hypothetical protein